MTQDPWMHPPPRAGDAGDAVTPALRTQPAPALRPAPRLACALAASATTGTIGLALLGAWQATGDPLWLAPTPAVMAEVATCEQLPAHEARTRCKQLIVEERLHAPRREVSVAAAPGEPR